jgi:ABC-type glycerol-3-phosphate transport system substrate-binding protein
MNSDKLSPFQLILFVIIVFLIIGGIATFALKRSADTSQLVPITMWGTLPENYINSYQEVINDLNKDSVAIIYTEFTEDEFESELISALASGEGPDSVIFSNDLIVKQENKLFTIGYDFYNQSNFKTDFIETGEFLLKEEGVLGIPFVVDPLVMYWNRTILNSEGVSQPPQYWEQFIDLVPKITRSDSSSNISRSAVSLGEFRNINNAKDIFTTLVLQAGNPIVIKNELGNYEAIFKERLGYSVEPADAAITFFTQFSNPSRDTYTWNRSLPSDDEMFVSGDLAFYFGFASERNSMVERNPNLNFGVSQIPQSRSNENIKRTGGKLYFLGILNNSQNIGAAYNTFIKLVDSQNMSYMYDIFNLPPVKRDLLVGVPSIDYRDTFNKSSLITSVLLDPDSDKTEEIFRKHIESVTSGRIDVGQAVLDINNDLNLLIND